MRIMLVGMMGGWWVGGSGVVFLRGIISLFERLFLSNGVYVLNVYMYIY